MELIYTSQEVEVCICYSYSVMYHSPWLQPYQLALLGDTTLSLAGSKHTCMSVLKVHMHDMKFFIFLNEKTL